jgi:uroporphyrinogen decarboxylase
MTTRADIQPLQRREAPDFQRFRRVLQRQGGRDYVPFFELCIDPQVFEPLTGLAPPVELNFNPRSPVFTETFGYYMQCLARMGFDHATINMCGFAGFPHQKHGVDGTARGFEQAGDGVLRTEEDFAKYPWPAAEQIDVERMRQTAAQAPEGMGVLTGGPAPFQTMMEIVGFDNLCLMLYEKPELFKAIADRIGAIMVAAADLCASLPFIQGFQLGGDMGYKTGTMLSPDDLRTYILPWHRKAVERIHAHGKLAILHSCGNLEAIMPDLIACGYDGKHSFEDAIEPGLLELHRRYGDRICLIGGVDVDFLCRADEAAVRRRVREYIDAMAPDGGYVLGSGNSIPDYCPVEKYWALLDEGLRYGR